MFFKLFITQPLFNVLIFLYQTVAFHNLGIAIILLTIIVRIVLLPLFYKSAKDQTLLQKIQPHIQKIQHDHKHDKEKQAQALLELYKTHKVNPFSGLFLIIAQMPILIGLFIILKELNIFNFYPLYSFVPDYGSLSVLVFGLIDIRKSNIIIVILTAIAQYVQSYLMLPKVEKGKELSAQEKTQRKMVFLAPVLTLVLFANFPSGATIYWLTSALFSIGQQVYINKSLKNQEVKI